MFENSFRMAQIVGVIVLILAISIFALALTLIFSSRLRAKLMGQQVRAMKYMMDEQKDNLTDINENMGDISINSQKNILDKHEDTLKDMASRNADIKAESFEKGARAIKKGLTEDSIYCKHCGSDIDNDSKFCKNCGKKI